MSARIKQNRELTLLATLVAVTTLAWNGYVVHKNAVNRPATLEDKFVQIDALGCDFREIVDDLRAEQSTTYRSTGRNIFLMSASARRNSGSTTIARFQIYDRPQPEPDPALDMVFFGYGALPANGPRQAFLKEKKSDNVHIVSEGSVLESHIRILHIGNEKIEFEDIYTGRRGSSVLEVPVT